MASNSNLLRIIGRVGRELSTGFDAQLKGSGLTSARPRAVAIGAQPRRGEPRQQ
ncbi:hypothetical protein N8D56_24740 [Devosia sp. A8/3-2]|nr:hypothetical protein N8D56_24740 [Devosia sp. A8/3-2]